MADLTNLAAPTRWYQALRKVQAYLTHVRPPSPAPGILERFSIEEPNDLARNVFPSRLFVIHDSGRCGENDVSELTGGKELDDPFFEVTELDIVARGDDTAFVQSESHGVRIEFMTIK